jgi:hypothetical protein
MSIVTETNVSPEIFAKNQTHVDLDAAPLQFISLSQLAAHRAAVLGGCGRVR